MDRVDMFARQEDRLIPRVVRRERCLRKIHRLLGEAAEKTGVELTSLALGLLELFF
jgi:hypothetical protein